MARSLPLVRTIVIAFALGVALRANAEQAASKPAPKDDLASLSDEFENEKTLADWRRAFEVDKTGADQLKSIDIGKTQKGTLTLVPLASTWYLDYRGVLVFKDVTGDFVATTKMHVSRRGGEGAPQSQFSLAGLMVRTPRDMTQPWRRGHENYVFLSLGAAYTPGRFAFEVKSTVNSGSNLIVKESDVADAQIRVARIGRDFILLRKEGDGAWQVHKRYRRPDMPASLEVGMTVYTDYPRASKLTPEEHNHTAIADGNPDLVAKFDFFHFRRPDVPASVKGRDLTDEKAVPDETLLKFLGE